MNKQENQDDFHGELANHFHEMPQADMRSGDYVECVISSTASRGPLGSNLHGWITYRNGAGKIYFEMTSEKSGDGWFAFAGFFPTVFALNPQLLKGTSGKATVVVAAAVGGLSLFAENGMPVLTAPLVGAAFGAGKMVCDVRFEFHPD